MMIRTDIKHVFKESVRMYNNLTFISKVCLASGKVELPSILEASHASSQTSSCLVPDMHNMALQAPLGWWPQHSLTVFSRVIGPSVSLDHGSMPPFASHQREWATPVLE